MQPQTNDNNERYQRFYDKYNRIKDDLNKLKNENENFKNELDNNKRKRLKPYNYEEYIASKKEDNNKIKKS